MDFIRQTPGKSIPPVYIAAIINQARKAGQLRRRAFFAAERGQGGRGGWENWKHLGRHRSKRRERPRLEALLRMVSTLLKTIAISHAEVISHSGGNFVLFD